MVPGSATADAAEEPAGGPAAIVEEGSGASEAVPAATDPATGVQIVDEEMLIAPDAGGE